MHLSNIPPRIYPGNPSDYFPMTPVGINPSWGWKTIPLESLHKFSVSVPAEITLDR